MQGNFHPQGSARKACTLLAALAAVTLLATQCGKPAKVYRVGILVGADTMDAIAAGFKARMTELGYVEGRNIEYDTRQTNANPGLEKHIAAVFVAEQVDLIFAFPGQPAGTAKLVARGTSIPVVFANALLEGTTLVDSVRSPGGNITGVRNPGPDLTLKCFQALLELTPPARRVIAVYDSTYPTNQLVLETLHSLAASSHVTLREIRIPDMPDTAAILRGLEGSGITAADAVLLFPDLITRSTEASDAILKFADDHRVPVAGGPPALVQEGAVLTASIDRGEQGSLAATLADQVLKGTPAGSIPVVTTQPRLFINYRKARQLGLTVPEGLLKQASGIIR